MFRSHVSSKSLWRSAPAALVSIALIASVPWVSNASTAPDDPSPDSPQTSEARATLYRVPVATVEDVDRIARLGLDIAGIDRKAGLLDVVGDADTAATLLEAGYSIATTRDLTPSAGEIDALSDYWSPSEIAAQIDAWIATYPELIAKTQYATTEEGRPVWAVKVSDNVGTEEDEVTILYVAQHHAREVMTPEIGMDIIEQLLVGYGHDPAVTEWVDRYEIWVLPNHNPDGADYVFDVNSNWRKNRRDNGDGNFGVDLNRNYPFKWGACNGSSSSTSSDTYRGPSPASEPETFGGILELAREHRPTINLSYHTYSELVLIPYGCDGSYTPELGVFRDLSSGMASKLVSDSGNYWYEPGTGWETLYAVDGEMTDWFYGELGSYGMTVEANASSQGFRPDYATWRDSTVDRNRPGWRYLLDRLDDSGILGNVTDACTGSPLEATTSLDELVFSNGENPRTSEPLHGRFHWLTVPGSYHLRAELSGYVTQVWPVDVGIDVVRRPVALVPTGSHGLAIRDVIVADEASDDDGRADPGEETDLFVRLVATGEDLTGVTATLLSDDPNVVVIDGSSSYGAIASGQTALGDGFRVQVASSAQDLDVASLRVVFSADASVCTDEEAFELEISTGALACPSIVEPLDVDPGWTIDNGGAPNGWAFGPPAGDGGDNGPDTAKTGENVYGTNLSGPYANNATYELTTSPFDLRGVRDAVLRFDRWLHNEAGFDIARVEASTDGGTTWTEIWAGFDYGDGWFDQRIDVASVADGQADVRFRFSIDSDAGTARSGFYIDDVSVCGEEVPNPAGVVKYLDRTVDDSDPDLGNGDGVVDAGETVELAVKVRSNRDTVSTGVEAFLTSPSDSVEIRNGYAVFEDVPAGGAGWSIAPGFSFTVDAEGCAERIPFELDVRWDGGSATSTFSIPVGAPQVAVVFDDDLETDLGWMSGGSASAGDFVLDDPYAVTDALDRPVQPEDDTTAGTGVRAWITANPQPKGNFDAGDGDVDGGTVWVESPPFDGTDADRLTLTYSRWFVRRGINEFDSSAFRVLASDDVGVTWNEVETLESDSAFWAAASVDLAPFVDSSSDVRVRFEVSESAAFGDPLIEGLVDDVAVERERLECTDYSAAPRSAPNPVGATLSVDKASTHLRLEWQAPVVDGSHDAASGYRVYRSDEPSAGFGVLARPTDPAHVVEDDLLVPTTGYFSVVAENSGGTSGDEPTP